MNIGLDKCCYCGNDARKYFTLKDKVDESNMLYSVCLSCESKYLMPGRSITNPVTLCKELSREEAEVWQVMHE